MAWGLAALAGRGGSLRFGIMSLPRSLIVPIPRVAALAQRSDTETHDAAAVTYVFCECCVVRCIPSLKMEPGSLGNSKEALEIYYEICQIYTRYILIPTKRPSQATIFYIFDKILYEWKAAT